MDFYNSDIGILGIKTERDFVTEIKFISVENLIESEKENIKTVDDFQDKSSSQLRLQDKAFLEIIEYLKGDREFFSFPIKPVGTSFQLRVWEALRDIPYGETRSYKDIAIAIGNEKACRAVGLANNKNKLPLIIPCHRVIGKNGKLVGFAGGLHVKEKLLQIEKSKKG